MFNFTQTKSTSSLKKVIQISSFFYFYYSSIHFEYYTYLFPHILLFISSTEVWSSSDKGWMKLNWHHWQHCHSIIIGSKYFKYRVSTTILGIILVIATDFSLPATDICRIMLIVYLKVGLWILCLAIIGVKPFYLSYCMF